MSDERSIYYKVYAHHANVLVIFQKFQTQVTSMVKESPSIKKY